MYVGTADHIGKNLRVSAQLSRHPEFELSPVHFHQNAAILSSEETLVFSR